ncbi:hypothetical protein ACNDUQ_005827, partial [Escherichia coli]
EMSIKKALNLQRRHGVTSPSVISLVSGDHSRRGFHGVHTPCNSTGRWPLRIRNKTTPLFNRCSVSH